MVTVYVPGVFDVFGAGDWRDEFCESRDHNPASNACQATSAAVQGFCLYGDSEIAGVVHREPVPGVDDGGGIEHGQFVVQQKQPGKEYVDPSGQTIAAGATHNPYGAVWIELAGNLGIHEANPQGGNLDRRGSIRLGSRDAQDVFGILSQGSQVTITR